MSYKTKKTEHCGPKRGKGIGHKAEVKRESSRRRRRQKSDLETLLGSEVFREMDTRLGVLERRLEELEELEAKSRKAAIAVATPDLTDAGFED